jgi:hypothetical protein
MKEFRNGVSYYTKGMVEISFPEDDVCCYRCPLMGFDYNRTDREYCKKTGEFLPSPKHMVGFDCPLKFENKENNDG